MLCMFATKFLILEKHVDDDKSLIYVNWRSFFYENRGQSVLMESLPIRSFHTVLFCRKWDECVVFYRDVLGFCVIDQKKHFMEFQVTQESRISLLKPKRSFPPEHRDQTFILSFCVSDIEETHRRLAARLPGLAEVKSHPWRAMVFELQDPEGRRIEFWSPADG